MSIQRPIYLYHIRKTGGRSLIFSFLNLFGSANEIYQDLAREKTLSLQSRKIVGWDKGLLERGDYFFGFSHIPYDKIRLPKNSFTITILRDPFERIVSHYAMVRSWIENKVDHPALKAEGDWAKDGFDAFLERIPTEHLNRQVSMFSKRLNVQEASERIQQCDHLIDLVEFDEGLKSLAQKLDLNLQPFRIENSSPLEENGKSAIKQEILSNQKNQERCRELLDKEYQLIENLSMRENYAAV